MRSTLMVTSCSTAGDASASNDPLIGGLDSVDMMSLWNSDDIEYIRVSRCTQVVQKHTTNCKRIFLKKIPHAWTQYLYHLRSVYDHRSIVTIFKTCDGCFISSSLRQHDNTLSGAVALLGPSFFLYVAEAF